MLNWLLAFIAAILWVGAFAWYFAPELQQWWKRVRERRAR